MMPMRQAGEVWLDRMFLLAIAGILAALAWPIYLDWTERTQADEVLAKFDALRRELLGAAGPPGVASCDELRARLRGTDLRDAHVHLDIGFLPVATVAGEGYRPVFSVCGEAGAPAGLGVARAAYRAFQRREQVEHDAVLRDSAISFVVPLTPLEQISCVTPPMLPPRACGDEPPGSGAPAG